MKTSKYTLFTCKNNTKKNKNKIYNFMIRGGLIRKSLSGIYIWLPNGIRIINNIKKIIRKTMNNLGANEIILPNISSSYLWKKSKRIFKYNELFKFYDRKKKLLILSPTHEEIITNFICKENNINNIPKILYQIQTKFRDEIRPKYGLIRSREFIMKDAYSFHNNSKCLNNTYYSILESYKNILKKIGLNSFYKEANCGNIGGSKSHEFHVISKYGENKIKIYQKNKYLKYSSFLKIKKYLIKKKQKKKKKLLKCKYISINEKNKFNYYDNFIKTYLILLKKKKKYIYILIPLKKKLDKKKIKNIFLYEKIEIFNEKKIYKKFKIKSLFLGPINKKYKIIGDYSLILYKNFIIGSNKKNKLKINVNLFRDIKINNFFDICKNYSNNIKKKKYISPIIEKSIEVAHIFKLENKYSNIFCKKNKNILMGCYGIGITRIICAIIDNYHDKRGIIWPISIANFKLGIIPINMYQFKNVLNFCNEIYLFLNLNKINILFDDRKLHFGKMITDFELIGIPNLLIISNKNLSIGLIEFRDRLNSFIYFIKKENIFNFLIEKYK